MPQQVPPFGENSRNNNHNNREFRDQRFNNRGRGRGQNHNNDFRNSRNNNSNFRGKANKQTTARPSTSATAQPPIQEEEIHDQIEEAIQKTNALDTQSEHAEDNQSICSSTSDIKSAAEQTVIELVVEETEVVVEEAKVVAEIEEKIEEVLAVVEEKPKFYRYSIDKLNELKEGNPLIATKISDMGHPLLQKSLKNETRKILFDRDIVVNDKVR
jgi:hypothetical protein